MQCGPEQLNLVSGEVGLTTHFTGQSCRIDAHNLGCILSSYAMLDTFGTE